MKRLINVQIDYFETSKHHTVVIVQLFVYHLILLLNLIVLNN